MFPTARKDTLDSLGNQRQLYGYGISAKRYALYTRQGSKVQLLKASEHGLGLYYRPKEGRDATCDVPLWVKEGWQWMLNRAFELSCQKPEPMAGGVHLPSRVILTPSNGRTLRFTHRWSQVGRA